MASFALVACGGPPEEATSLDRAAGEADLVGFCLAKTPPPSLPVQSPVTHYGGCIIQLYGVSRTFASSTFEQGLLGFGCKLSLVPGAPPGPINEMPVANYPERGLNTTYNITACPAGCALDNFLAANAATWTHSTITRKGTLPGTWQGTRNPDGSIVDAHESASSPDGCYPLTPPANVVYVEWDPKCTGGCVGYSL